MMIDDTPSPARAGRLAGSSSFGGRQRLDPELAGAEAAGKVLEQIEGLGQHMVAPHRLELGNVERGENGAQAPACPGRGYRRRPGRRLDRIAGVEQHRAALLHIGVDMLERLARRLWCARHDRPIDQRIEGKLVARGIEADRLARFERGTLREEQA